MRETDRAKVKITTMKRTVNFIKRARRGNRRLLKKAINQDEKMGSKSKIRRFLKEVGKSVESANRLREEGRLLRTILDRASQLQGQWEYNKTQGAKYNKRYKEIFPIGRPRI